MTLMMQMELLFDENDDDDECDDYDAECDSDVAAQSFPPRLKPTQMHADL